MNQPTYKDLLANTWINLAKELENEAGDEVSRKAATNRAYAKCLQTCAEQLHRAPVETRMDEEYLELLMAVKSKHAGETRHQTALRYIMERNATPAPESQRIAAGTADEKPDGQEENAKVMAPPDDGTKNL